MEYDNEFTYSFMNRTIRLIDGYDGPWNATLLVNCLLGLLIIPHKDFLEKIPTTKFESLKDWGINPSSILKFGRCEAGVEHSLNLRQLVRRLRNAVAHFRIEPHHKDNQVWGYSFRDLNGFHALISLPEIKAFVLKIATYLDKQI